MSCVHAQKAHFLFEFNLMNKSCYSVDDIHTGKLVKVEVPQYLSAAKSYALAADSSSSYAPKKVKGQKK